MIWSPSSSRTSNGTCTRRRRRVSSRLINSSTYAKYYFALRAIGEKVDFRRRYNYLVHVRPEKSTSIEVVVVPAIHV